MARPNKLGTSFMSLGLEKEEEEVLIKYLNKKKWSGKRYLRFLIRKDLKTPIELPTNENRND